MLPGVPSRCLAPTAAVLNGCFKPASVGQRPFSLSCTSSCESRPKLPPAGGRLYSEKRLLGYTCDQMFQVVSEVHHYHRFVPWCKKSTVVNKDKDGNGVSAQLVIGFPPFVGESYISHVGLYKPYLVTSVCIDMTLFDDLRAVWKMNPIEEDVNACILDFAVAFKFKSSIHSMVTGLFFDEVVKRNVSSFLGEAETRFGPQPDKYKHKKPLEVIVKR